MWTIDDSHSETQPYRIHIGEAPSISRPLVDPVPLSSPSLVHPCHLSSPSPCRPSQAKVSPSALECECHYSLISTYPADRSSYLVTSPGLLVSFTVHSHLASSVSSSLVFTAYCCSPPSTYFQAHHPMLRTIFGRRSARTQSSRLPPNSHLTMEVLSRARVHEVRSILSSFNIPTELVLRIMDIAEYHPTVRAERSDNLMTAAGHNYHTDACWAAQLYLVSEPLPRSPDDLFWRVKKVSWELEGHDQGWTTSHIRGM